MEGLSDLERRVAEAAAARDAATSPAERRAHGVVHTPAALCRHMVRRVDAALIETLGLAEGLASPRVTLVDPACGPGAFMAAALAALEGRGMPAAIVGIDRDVGALATAQSALAAPGRPLRFVEADALESLAPLEADVLVVLGNPPWAGRSESRTPLVDALLEDFRRDAAGVPLGERKIGVLSDAYVRFLRWAAEGVRQAPGGGVLALVTNASFLDGPVHRGMRAALARFFDRLEIADLGGSALVAKRREGDAGEPARDENLFGVRPGAAITIGVRRPERDEGALGEVGLATLRGARAEKLAALAAPLRFAPIDPARPWRVRAGASAWPKGWRSLAALFPFHREGVQTNRDGLVTDASHEALLGRLQTFALGLHDPRLDAFTTSRGHFDVDAARRAVAAALQADPRGEGFVEEVAYRPFERRWLATLPAVCHRSRADLRAAMARSTFALLSVRKDRGERGWTHAAASAIVPDNCFLSARSSCRTRAFPTHDAEGAPNLSAEGRAWLGSERSAQLLWYALTWISSATYQARFEGLLAEDYPRVPPPGPAFDALVESGRALVEAFEARPPFEDGCAVDVGHWRVRGPSALAGALADADARVAEALADLG
ncbi:MAG: methyltransferase [Myxococcales bacterium]|nr:methyltransferase [Myxococcales bacterium]